ncbi:MAG: phenylalanine--tRNA ligase subunit beta, partial [Desulfobacteraceae bacterium]|nr:phenylalanine--tRNA ligase subunit beta [Desulfobacteraceae bacterium]
SEIDESTTRVLLESAYFNPISIRKTSKALGLNTDATHRFERGVDPDGTIRAINRASQLIAELGGGLLIDGIIDHRKGPVKKCLIPLNVKDTNRLLGTNFDLKIIKGLLQSIEFKVEPKDEYSIDVYPPSFRVDILRPEDLMEEVARLSGYNNIPVTFPQASGESKKPSKTPVERNRIKSIMLGFGFTEVINYSFIHKLSCDHLNFHPDDPKRNMVEILNPLTEDQTVMRTSLVPGVLGTMNLNISQQTRNLKIFEIGKIFLNNDEDSLPEEIEMVSGLWTGSCHDASWHSTEKQCDFYDIKGVLEGMFNTLKIENITFTKTPEKSLTFTKTGYSADVYIENELIGIVGEVDQQVLSTFGLKQKAFVFELNLDSLLGLIPDTISSKPVPKYPAVFRDSTIIIDNNIEATSIKNHIDLLKEDLVESIRIFDIYEGEPISKGNKSISFRITYRSSVETLEDDYVSKLHKNITYNLVKKLDATLPGDQ